MGARWAKSLASAFLARRVALVGLVDVDLRAANQVASECGLGDAVIGSDLDAVLEKTKPDIVFDVAVPASRREVVQTAFRYGCNVLTEKPMAASMADARTILEAARRSGRLHAVTQNRRFKQSARRIRQFLHSGALGDLSSMHCDFFIGAHFGGFRDQMEHVLLIDMAIHTFDIARFMSGRDAVSVYCQENNPKGSWYAHGAAANAIFELGDGIVYNYRGSWAAEGANTSWEAAWRIVGSKGTLLWDGESEISANVVDGDQGFFRPLKRIDVPTWTDDSVTHEHESVIANFLDALETGTTPESSGSDNIKSLSMVFGAIESAKRRQLVLLEDGKTL
jgi:predicted dehydrogenase